MTGKNRFIQFLFYLIMGTVYTYALSQLILSATILEISPSFILRCCVLFLLVFYGMFFNKYAFLVSAGLLLISSAALFLYLKNQQFQASWFLQLRASVDELYRFSRDLLPYSPHYELPICLFITGVLAFLTALNLHVYFNFYLLLLIGAGVVAVPAALDYETSRPALILYLLSIIVFLCKRLNSFAVGKAGELKRPNASFILAIIPFCTIILTVSYFLPKPNTTTEEQRSQSPSIAYHYSNWANDLASQMNSTAFTEGDTQLGGTLEENNQLVMEVYAQERVYLSGKVLDTYMGASWHLRDNSKQPLATVDNNSLYAIRPAAPDLWDDFWEYQEELQGSVKTVEIHPIQNTQTVFSPAYQHQIQLYDAVEPYQNANGSISVEPTLSYGLPYTLSYLSWPDTSSVKIEELLIRLEGATEAGLDLTLYRTLPNTLPQRVYDLAEELTQGAGSQYEKVLALQEYLIRFPYTLTPSPVPPGDDFVDYFLFTGQEGYCTYYATALAVLARCVGIPTRYLEGYVMPESQSAQGSYLVTNAQAHAWMEAYFPGFGWVAFEATSPYYYGFYEQDLPDPVEIFTPDMLENHEDEIDRFGFETDKQDEQPDFDPEYPKEPGEVGGVFPASPFVWLLFLCIAGTLAAWGYRVFRLRKIDLLSNQKACVAYFMYLLKAAKLCGYPIYSDETAIHYALRIGDSLSFEQSGTSLDELARLFSKAAYSPLPISSEEKALMRGCCYELRSKIWRCWLNRFAGWWQSHWLALRRRAAHIFSH